MLLLIFDFLYVIPSSLSLPTTCPPRQFIGFSYSYIQWPAFPKTAESAGAPLALTCSVVDETHPMQTNRETKRTEEEGRKWGIIDVKMQEGRKEDKEASGTRESSYNTEEVWKKIHCDSLDNRPFNCLLHLFLHPLPLSITALINSLSNHLLHLLINPLHLPLSPFFLSLVLLSSADLYYAGIEQLSKLTIPPHADNLVKDLSVTTRTLACAVCRW